MRSIYALAAAAMLIVATSMPLRGDRAAENEILAGKISGTWAFNQKLSPTFGGTRRAGRGRPSGGTFFPQQGSAVPTQQRYPQGVRANPTNTEPTDEALSDLTPSQRAELIAFRETGLILPVLTIEATAAHVTFSDDRGESECNVTGKTEKVRLFGAWLDVKCRWDKTVLRQELSNSRSKLVRTWTVDDRGVLVMKSRVEGMNENTPEATAVFDRIR
jgi:hypothetical protein